MPLASFTGQNANQIAQELAGQFTAWPEAANQVGLLDQEGRGRVDAFVDVPAANIFRLYRQRAYGTLTVDAFSLRSRPGEPAYGELIRRLEAATIRQTGRSIADLLAVRPAGPVRVLGETAEFAWAQALVLAGRYGEAARVEGGGARTTDFRTTVAVGERPFMASRPPSSSSPPGSID